MSEFIVLGLIPGTHVAISFALWLTVISVLGAVLAARTVKQSRGLRAWVVTVRLAMLTRRRLA